MKRKIKLFAFILLCFMGVLYINDPVKAASLTIKEGETYQFTQHSNHAVNVEYSSTGVIYDWAEKQKYGFGWDSSCNRRLAPGNGTFSFKILSDEKIISVVSGELTFKDIDTNLLVYSKSSKKAVEKTILHANETFILKQLKNSEGSSLLNNISYIFFDSKHRIILKDATGTQKSNKTYQSTHSSWGNRLKEGEEVSIQVTQGTAIVFYCPYDGGIRQITTTGVMHSIKKDFELKEKNITIYQGETTQLHIKSLSDGHENVIFESPSILIASVDSKKGIVEGKKPGTVNILAISDTGYTQWCTVTVLEGTAPPPTVTLKVKKHEDKAITLTWNAVNTRSYTLLKSEPGKGYVQVAVISASRYSSRPYYRDSNLKPGVTYKYKIEFPFNRKSVFSKVLTVPTLPSKPSITTKEKNGTVTLQWKEVKGASGYEIYYSNSSQSGSFKLLRDVKIGKCTSALISDLKQKSNGYFRMRAYIKYNGKKLYSAYSNIKKQYISEVKIQKITFKPANNDEKDVLIPNPDGSTDLNMYINIYPIDAGNKKVQWSIKDTNIAKINGSSKITIVSPGSTTVTCKATDGSNVSCTFKIKVLQKAWFPQKIMKISQIAYESYSHKNLNAIDCTGGTYIYAPFDGKIVNKKPSYSRVLFQSIDKVYYADGTHDFMTIELWHSSDYNKLKKYGSNVIEQQEPFYKLGKTGASGLPDKNFGIHAEIRIFRGKRNTFTDDRSKPNVFAYDAFFLNTNFTTIGKLSEKNYKGQAGKNGAGQLEWANTLVPKSLNSKESLKDWSNNWIKISE